MIAYNLSLEFEPSWVQGRFVIPSGVACQAVAYAKGMARASQIFSHCLRLPGPFELPLQVTQAPLAPFYETRHFVATFYLARPLLSHVLSRQSAIRTKRVVDNT